MERQHKLISAALLLPACLALGAALPAMAAKKPAAKKPAPKRRPVKGTTQFKGDQAQLGQMYTLGKEEPINIAVNSVRYSAERIRIGENCYVPKANEKLLVIDFMLQNPNKTETLARFDTVHFFAVDSKDVNRENPQQIGVPETQEDLNMNLKPGQKRTAYAYIVVPADASIPKLVVKSPDDLVLRYDLHGKIKGLQAPYADPKDTTGATALAEVPSALNTPMQLGGGDEGSVCDLVVQKVAYANGALGEFEPDEGKRLLVLTARVTNPMPQKLLYRFDSLNPVVVTTDDERIEVTHEMLALSGNRSIEHNLEKGTGAGFRMFFQVPKDAKVKTLLVREQEEDRVYAIDISDVK